MMQVPARVGVLGLSSVMFLGLLKASVMGPGIGGELASLYIPINGSGTGHPKQLPSLLFFVDKMHCLLQPSERILYSKISVY